MADNKPGAPSPEMQEMQRMFAEQNERMTGLLNTVEQQGKTIDKLSRALDAKNKPVKEAPKPVIPTSTFTSGGQEYKFKVPMFQIGKDTITATDALANQQLLDDLVAKKSGVIECLDKEDEE